ncbi:MAG: lipoyl(octanoyl) transferase, partial [Phototrophicales bacterium]
MRYCSVHWAGCVAYETAWQWQKILAMQRAQDQCLDTLLLLEHPHTYTLGSAGKLEHLLMSEPERIQKGVSVFHVDRGGDITYHGPGQLVGYPILQLETNPKTLRADVVAYIRQLEEVIIESLQYFDIHGVRYPPYTGVWVSYNEVLHKIAAIGVKVNVKRITQHGFALNVHPDMQYFKGIIPCGIDDKPVISM